MPTKYLTTDELAEMLQVHPNTLARWRSEGHGPKYIKIGSSVRYYPLDEVAA